MNQTSGGAEQSKALARRFVETLGGPNPGAIVELFAEDSWIHTTGSSVVSGRRRPAELKTLLGALATAVPSGLRFEIKNVIGEGDQAVCEVLGKAVTADGRPYNNHYAFWFRTAGGKITLLTEFLDTRLVDEIFKQRA